MTTMTATTSDSPYSRCMSGPPALLPLPTARLTYVEVGATAGLLPARYHHLRRRRVVGHGSADFQAAADALMRWDLHRRSGLTLAADSEEAAEDVNVILGFGVGRWRIQAPCRVVYTVNDPDRRGFAYGTLPGHPESGEERFTVTQLADGRVELAIVAFSRPQRWWSKLGAPLGRMVQAAVTERYLRALSGPR